MARAFREACQKFATIQQASPALAANAMPLAAQRRPSCMPELSQYRVGTHLGRTRLEFPLVAWTRRP
jgi:hypothetical protein